MRPPLAGYRGTSYNHPLRHPSCSTGLFVYDRITVGEGRPTEALVPPIFGVRPRGPSRLRYWMLGGAGRATPAAGKTRVKQTTTAQATEPAGLVADERILILDFGSQYAQLIARRVREQHVYCEIVRHDITAERIRELAPRGHHPLRRSGQRLRGRRPKCDPEIFKLGIPVLGICYGMQLACEALGGKVDEPSRPRVRPRRRPRHLARRPVRRRARRHGSLDEPRRPGLGRLRRLRAAGHHRHLPHRGGQAQAAAGLWLAVSSRSDAHAAGRAHAGQLPLQDLRLPRHLATGRFRRPGDRADSPARRQRPRDLRSVRRRRFVGRGRAALPGHRLAALLHPRRQRPAAQGRRRIGDRGILESLPHRPARGQGRRAVSWRRWPASPIRRKSAAASATRSSNASPTKPPRSPAPASWPRARSIPT